MAHIPPRPVSDYHWLIRPFLRRQRRKYGAVLAPSLLWARLPMAFLGMLAMLGIFNRRRFPLDRRLRSLASIRIAQLNGCHFCVDLNAYLFLAASGEEAKAERVAEWRQHEDFSTTEHAVLDYAEKVTTACGEVGAADIDALRQHFSDDQITALTAWIGFQNMSAKFNAALGAEEHGFCQADRSY